jgi:mono/diheme cytochrome c family protein
MISGAGVRLIGAIGVTALVLAACSGPADTATSAPSTSPTLAPPDFSATNEVPPPPDLDDLRITAGEVLYQQQCAVCHKADLSGEPGWMIPNDDGTLKPPPQDFTGHTWHHADQLLLEIVRDGTVSPIAVMPTFGGILTDEEIVDILEFLKSRWGVEERAFQWEISWRAEQGAG